MLSDQEKPRERRAKVLVRMSSPRDRIIREEDEEVDSLGCPEDSLEQKTTVTAIGKVNQICNCQ